MEGIIFWLLMGVVAGAIGRFLMPGVQNLPWWQHILVGIVGAMLGGWLGSFLPILRADAGQNWSLGSILTAGVGAFLVLFIWSRVAGASRRV